MQECLNYLCFRWKSKVLILCLLFIGSTIFINSLARGEYSGLLEAKGVYGLSFFYTSLSAGTLYAVYIILILITPNLFASEFLINRNNGFSNLIKSRIGYKRYFKNNIIILFVSSFVTLLVFQLFVLLLIHMVYAPIEFTYFSIGVTSTSSQFLHPNEIINLVLYIVCTSLGYGIFSVFLFSMQAWLRNVYLFRLSGLIAGLLLSTGIVMVGKGIYNMIPNLLIEHIAAGTFIGNLINPGDMMTNATYLNVNSLVAFCISCIIYGTITILLLKKLYKTEYNND